MPIVTDAYRNGLLYKSSFFRNANCTEIDYPSNPLQDIVTETTRMELAGVTLRTPSNANVLQNNEIDQSVDIITKRIQDGIIDQSVDTITKGIQDVSLDNE